MDFERQGTRCFYMGAARGARRLIAFCINLEIGASERNRLYRVRYLKFYVSQRL